MLLENYFYTEKDVKKIDNLYYIKIRHPYYKYMVITIFKIKLDSQIRNFKSKYYEFSNSMLFIKQGYTWDGASGPTIDTSSIMIASLVHDVIYQAIREGAPIKKKEADLIFYKLMLKKSNSFISKIRAKYFLFALKLFGTSSTRGGVKQ